MLDDLDRMARESFEPRREDEPHRPRLTSRQVALTLVISVVLFVAFALVLGERAVSGAVQGFIFALVILVFESWRRR